MKNRNIAAVMALSFVTLGIYTLFWLKSTRDEMVARGAKIPPIGWIIAAVVGLVVLTVLALIVAIAGGILESGGASGAGAGLSVLGIIGLFGLVVIVYPLVGIGIGYWIYRYCQAVEYVTKGQTQVALSFSMWIVLQFLVGFGFVWPGIIQDGLNNVGPADSETATRANTPDTNAGDEQTQQDTPPQPAQPTHQPAATTAGTTAPTHNTTPPSAPPVPAPHAHHDKHSTS